MQSADWKMISSILLVLGAIFSVGGGWIWANVAGYNGWRGMLDYYDYRGYPAPLIIVGISFLVIGFYMWRRSEIQNAVPPPPEPESGVPVGSARRF